MRPRYRKFHGITGGTQRTPHHRYADFDDVLLVLSTVVIACLLGYMGLVCMGRRRHAPDYDQEAIDCGTTRNLPLCPRPHSQLQHQKNKMTYFPGTGDESYDEWNAKLEAPMHLYQACSTIARTHRRGSNAKVGREGRELSTSISLRILQDAARSTGGDAPREPVRIRLVSAPPADGGLAKAKEI